MNIQGRPILVLIAMLIATLIVLVGCKPDTPKSCSATVVAPPVPTTQCTGCPDDFKGQTINRPCTGEKQDVCPLKAPYTEACQNLNGPVDTKATCTVSLKEITACK
jgi:hypothetical protein